jgi:hypothetical protein
MKTPKNITAQNTPASENAEPDANTALPRHPSEPAETGALDDALVVDSDPVEQISDQSSSTREENDHPNSDDGLLIHVPDFGPTMTDAQHEEWSKATFEASSRVEHLEMQSRAAFRQRFAMAFLSAIAYPPSYFSDKLLLEGTGVPKSNNPFAPAFAYYFRLDVAHIDAKKRSNNSKQLNRYITSALQLEEVLPKHAHNPDKFAVPYSPTGVLQIDALLQANGGAAGVGKGSEERNKEHSDIKVDGAKLEERIIELGDRLIEQQTGAATRKIGIGYADNSGDHIAYEIDLSQAMKAEAYAQLPIGDPRVLFLAELSHLAQAVPEERTSEPTDHNADPNDPATTMRDASRLYVLHPEGGLTVSNILQNSGIVLEVRPNVDLLNIPVVGHAVLATKQRRRMESILTLPGLPLVLDYEVGSASGTQGICRIDIRSDVFADAGSDGVSVLVMQSRGEMPLVVDRKSFDPQSKGTIGSLTWTFLVNELAGRLATLKKPETLLVAVELDQKSLVIRDPRSSHGFDAQVTKPAKAKVRLDDLFRFFQAATKVRLISDVTISVDPQMVSFEFATTQGRYGMHLPAAQAVTGHDVPCQRSAKHVTKLKAQGWPQLNSAE